MTTALAESSPVNTPENVPGLRILVVEDYADCAASMEMLLRLFGHEVTIVRSGPEAIDAARAGQPDVVLLDIGLPGMNGFEVARKLHGERTKKTPWLVAVTGYGQETDLQHSREAGIDLHLVKPVDPDKLRATLSGFQRRIHASLPGDEETVSS